MVNLSEGVQNLALQQNIKSSLPHSYDHQTWQGGDLPWGAPIDIVTWPFNQVVLLDRAIN